MIVSHNVGRVELSLSYYVSVLLYCFIDMLLQRRNVILLPNDCVISLYYHVSKLRYHSIADFT